MRGTYHFNVAGPLYGTFRKSSSLQILVTAPVMAGSFSFSADLFHLHLPPLPTNHCKSLSLNGYTEGASVVMSLKCVWDECVYRG